MLLRRYHKPILVEEVVKEVEIPSNDFSELTKKEIIEKLEGMNVKFSPRDTKDHLLNLLQEGAK